MKVLAAEFVTSASAAGTSQGIPADGLARIAFAGRSNVGKSTLLNALVRRKIARTSAAPGKTRLANIFRVEVDGDPGGPGRWRVYFVDLPGYGYARGGTKAAAELQAVAESYFLEGERLPPERGAGLPAEGRPSRELEPREARPPNARAIRRLVLLLVDSRHPGLEADIQAHQWLAAVAGPLVVVATKIDKLSRAGRARSLRELERHFGTAALPVSAASGEGLDELWKLIARAGRNNATNGNTAGGRTAASVTETAGAGRADALNTAAGRRATGTRRAGS